MHTLHEHFSTGICISQTDELYTYWRQYMPQHYIYNKFSPWILLAVFARQKAIVNQKGLTDEEGEKKARCFNDCFIILDDVISDTSITYDPSIAELFVAGLCGLSPLHYAMQMTRYLDNPAAVENYPALLEI